MISYYIVGTVVSTLVIVSAFLTVVRWLMGRIDHLEERVITQGELLANIQGRLGRKKKR